MPTFLPIPAISCPNQYSPRQVSHLKRTIIQVAQAQANVSVDVQSSVTLVIIMFCLSAYSQNQWIQKQKERWHATASCNVIR